MNYGIILFIYDRPQCTAKVLEALKRNHIGELYVFQDGLGEKTDQTAWKQNEELIRQIDWCKVVFEQNKQKATSLDRQIERAGDGVRRDQSGDFCNRRRRIQGGGDPAFLHRALFPKICIRQV